ncbi:MAG: hypothetical protein GX099_07885 [Clostridiaceae bacterium]|jgi:hypothetical protein|nr:hypothetical protein [Oscillospiraceae bacterium]NLO63329.1 hypothetical protein [Clostridiaceae bacterium]
MSNTIQAAIAFPVAFIFTVGILSAGPILYAQTNDCARMNYEYVNEQSKNTSIYEVGNICVNSAESDTIYTSPERMQYLINSLRDSAELIVKGVGSLW